MGIDVDQKLGCVRGRCWICEAFRPYRIGLLYLIPLAATIFAVYWLFTAIDGTVRTIVGTGLGVELRVGVGLVLSIAIIILVGFLSSLFIARPLIQLIDRVLGKLPLVKLLYNSLKDLVGAFVGKEKKFDKPVAVDLTADGAVRALGFVTRASMAEFGLADDVAVYFPQAYNFAGNVLIIRSDRVHAIDADSSEVMTFVVSGGVSGGGHHAPGSDR